MAKGKNCPNCGKDIGIWAVFKSLLPSLARCSHCQAKLKYSNVGTIIILWIIVQSLIGIPAGWYIGINLYSNEIYISILVFLAALLTGSIIEIFGIMYLRSHKQLVLRDSDNQGIDRLA